ncbi:sulfite oxidase [Deinococcus sp. PESE-13]
MLITRQHHPDNLETPAHALLEPLTPAHYVRSHFAVPALDAAEFRLKVAGQVASPLSLSLAELRALPATTRTLTLECAGNGRVYLTPKASGVQWEVGAVGTAQWTGVPLRTLLERAGVADNAREVVLVGADEGQMDDPVKSPGHIYYSRSLPLSKALDNVLLAYEMNGEALTPAHGAPLRAIVPGWYGMAAVKWLTEIRVIDHAYQGYFQTVDYARWERQDGLPPVRVPLSEMRVKSQILTPAPHACVQAGEELELCGAAWTGGDRTVQRVEVSTDGGQSWQDAEWQQDAAPGVWRHWHLSWTPQQPGEVKLLSRATDSAGQVQPAAHDPHRGSYEVHHIVAVPVTVKAKQEHKEKS